MCYCCIKGSYSGKQGRGSLVITYRNLKKYWLEKFKTYKIENADIELNELLGHVLKTDWRSGLFSDLLDKTADACDEKEFDMLCKRRINGEPLQYILGEWEFYGKPIKVGKGVLIPRQDTETLVDIVKQKIKGKNNLTLIDLCSGSGCIAVALAGDEFKDIYCVEKSPEAFKYLVENIKLNSCNAKAVLDDVLEQRVIDSMPMADVITCNPPYLTQDDMENLQKEVGFEPSDALFGGEDGLDYYRDIIRLWKNKLNENGLMIFEIGIGQEDEVMSVMIQHGFKDVRVKSDLCGVNRCVFGFRRESQKLCTDVMSV